MNNVWTLANVERRLNRRMNDAERAAFAGGKFPKDWPEDVAKPAPVAAAPDVPNVVVTAAGRTVGKRGDIERRPPEREVERLLDAKAGVVKLNCGHRTIAKKYVANGALPDGLKIPCRECPTEVVRA